MAGRSLFHHTCLITPASSQEIESNSAKQLKNNTEHTAHQYQKSAAASVLNGTNSIGAHGAFTPEQSAPLPSFEPHGLWRDVVGTL